MSYVECLQKQHATSPVPGFLFSVSVTCSSYGSSIYIGFVSHKATADNIACLAVSARASLDALCRLASWCGYTTVKSTDNLEHGNHTADVNSMESFQQPIQQMSPH